MQIKNEIMVSARQPNKSALYVQIDRKKKTHFNIFFYQANVDIKTNGIFRK